MVEQGVTTPKKPGTIPAAEQPQFSYSSDAKSYVHNDNEGNFSVVPGVDPTGKPLSSGEAYGQYKKTGRHLGSFDSAQDAQKYADFTTKQFGVNFANKIQNTVRAGAAIRELAGNITPPDNNLPSVTGMIKTAMEDFASLVDSPYEFSTPSDYAKEGAEQEAFNAVFDLGVGQAGVVAGKAAVAGEAFIKSIASGNHVSMFGATPSPRASRDVWNRFNAQQSKAFEMRAKGRTREEVFYETGMVESIDGKWKYEVAHPDMRFNKEAMVYNLGKEVAKSMPELGKLGWTHGKNSAGTVKDFLHSPTLFKQWPELGDIKINIVDRADIPRTGGWYDMLTNEITLNKTVALTGLRLDPNYLNKFMIHEMQHVLQNGQGMAPGANPKQIFKHYDEMFKKANKLIGETVKEKGGWSNLTQRELDNIASLKSMQAHVQSIVDNEGEYFLYRYNPGEVDARLAEQLVDHPGLAGLFPYGSHRTAKANAPTESSFLPSPYDVRFIPERRSQTPITSAEGFDSRRKALPVTQRATPKNTGGGPIDGRKTGTNDPL
jgi:hypothetical protein